MKSFIIEIEDAKYEEFVKFCQLNSISPEAFIKKSFLEKYILLKYGDLNEKINGETQENPEKKKSQGRKKKNVEENIGKI